MGSSGSTCMETPVKVVYNKHLGNVLDPRSPTSGILRTPIEVLSSPSPSPGEAELGEEKEEEEEEKEQEDICDPRDPRSPTPGVNRTPLKPTMTDKISKLVKQLSGVFVGEEPESEVLVAPGEGAEAGPEEPVDQLLECEEEPAGDGRAGRDPVGEEARPGPAQAQAQGPSVGDATEGPQLETQAPPRSRTLEGAPGVMKRKRVKQAGKTLMVLENGRSPLQVLRDDNSPTSTLARRQVKTTLGLSQNLSDPSPRNLLKMGRGRQCVQDKENESYRLLTGELTVSPP
ncbi:cell division cycle-associated protein 3 [Heptranchias perlo]|uniref:cell division cycle-associated protein 3 n=1 Tax=Heptranchias perlo TaxID=212740 RepID=UPI003559FEFF